MFEVGSPSNLPGKSTPSLSFKESKPGPSHADVVELEDTLDLGASGDTTVRVRIPPSALDLRREGRVAYDD